MSAAKQATRQATNDRRLAELRQRARAALNGWSDAEARTRAHPELSPLAWHIGHLFFVETYWLREVVAGDASATARWHPLYFPENCAKDARAERLPAPAPLLAWTRELEQDNQAFWRAGRRGGHPLMAADYLADFLRQHYAQHLETIAMVVQQHRLSTPEPPEQSVLTASAPVDRNTVAVPAGICRVGSDDEPLAAYDNEVPAFTTPIAAFDLACWPVTNAQWLSFMQAGGYRQPRWWSKTGRAWLTATATCHPQHWRPYPDGGWFCPDPRESLQPDQPVHGLCAHEADAFARWAGARLPHEHEWEHAARLNLPAGAGEVWEWCSNTLFPYAGFRAFPYTGYSKPWFDGGHRVLRGASRHSRREIRRPGFRNFYPPGYRHVFAGLRLVW